ncbi:acyltransferase [Flavobacteriaceae bacterium F08102]|nr:acyltransferase [Flavobacteriaceae bacterium F08102]
MISKLKNKIDTDFSGFVFGKLRAYRLMIYSFFCTVWNYFIFRLKGVKIKPKVRFYGKTYVRRSFNSIIDIGPGCTFRSDKTSNLIGLNRRCMISTFHEGAIVKIGEKSGFSGTVIGAAQSIQIGENVLSGANVLITDFDWHPIDPKLRHTSEGVKSAPVVIEDNVWLGINSVVLKGVTIGENTVIGANSVVVKDIPANVIAAGNPCRVIKKLE